MTRWTLALGACAAFSALSIATVAYGNDTGDAVLGGVVGGVVGGLIGSGRVAVVPPPAPLVVVPVAPRLVVPAPPPAVVWRHGPPVAHDHGRHRGWYKHGGPHRRWDDD